MITPLDELYARVGKQLCMAAYRRKFPDAKSVDFATMTKFFGDNRNLDDTIVFVDKVIKLVQDDLALLETPPDEVLAKWRNANRRVKELESLVDKLVNSTEHAIGAALINAIKLANEKAKSQ